MQTLIRNFTRFAFVKTLSLFVVGNGVIERKRDKEQWVYDKDEMMGGKVERPLYFPNGIDEKYLGTMESQAITAKDFWTCVSNSFCRVIQIILQFLITIDEELRQGLDSLGFIDEKGNVNISQRALAVMSGTIPGKGNSTYKVAETARTMGLVSEKFCPTLPGMTQWQYFNLPAGTYAQAKKFLQLCDLFHEDFIGEMTTEVFTHGALQTCVNSPYTIRNGVVQPQQVYRYNHAVTAWGTDQYRKICDSYPEFLKNFALNYRFSGTKVLYVQKKNEIMNLPLIQYAGGIYFLAKAGRWQGKYVGFDDGDNYKAHFGEYSQLKRETVAKLPMNMARHEDGTIVREKFI